MSIIDDYLEEQKLAAARRQRSLHFLPFSVNDLFQLIRLELFPEITIPVDVRFVVGGPLACICHTDEKATIYMHQLLNHAETPIEVISAILKHELLHLRIPPAKVAGRMTDHPPEFREAEKAIAPELGDGWIWIYWNYLGCIKRRPRLERIDVLRNWKEVWARPKVSVQEWKEQRGLNSTPVAQEFC